jgi:hypothetical protein
MKGLGLAMAVGGWVIAVGGLLAVDDTMMRMALAVAGFATAIAGLITLNRGHLEDALWKRGS